MINCNTQENTLRQKMGGTVWDHSPSFTEKKTRSDLGQRLSQLGHISFQTTYFVYCVVKYALKKKYGIIWEFLSPGKRRGQIWVSLSHNWVISPHKKHILCTM